MEEEGVDIFRCPTYPGQSHPLRPPANSLRFLIVSLGFLRALKVFLGFLRISYSVNSNVLRRSE